MILVGYHFTGGYKFLDAKKKRVVISRDVIVDKIKEMQHPVTGYVKGVTGYNFETSDSIDTRSAETLVAEARSK